MLKIKAIATILPLYRLNQYQYLLEYLFNSAMWIEKKIGSIFFSIQKSIQNYAIS